MRVRDNLGSLMAAVNTKVPTPPPSNIQIGKVFGVVLDENTPSKALFNRAGGWSGIGTVYYLDYEQSKNLAVEDVDLNTCKPAKPNADNQNYPLIGELVHLIDAPGPTSQLTSNTAQKYYTGTINVWNTSHQNSLSDDSLGKTFTEKSDYRDLRSFAGDKIYPGRFGQGIRFGSTVTKRSDVNEWSSIGKDGDPITIIVNGYITTNTGSLGPNIEEINKEMSSIYMTSTQKLPLQPGTNIVNPRVNTVKPSDYISSQLIFNSDRITLNSKKDEVLLFAKTNIELNSDNIININAKTVAHINSPSIALGTNKDGTYPTEPLLLGNKTSELFLEILASLTTLAGFLSQASAATTTGAAQVASCQAAGTQLFSDISRMLNKLESITSQNVYTV